MRNCVTCGLEILVGIYHDGFSCIHALKGEVSKLNLQNGELVKIIEGLRIDVENLHREVEARDRLVGRMQNALEDIITKTVTAHDGGAILPIREMAQRGLGLTERPVDPLPTIEDLLGECRECNRLCRDCGNHPGTDLKRKGETDGR